MATQVAPEGFLNFRQITVKANEQLGDFDGKKFTDVSIAKSAEPSDWADLYTGQAQASGDHDDSNRLSLPIERADKWIAALVEWKRGGSHGPTPRPQKEST